MTPEERFNHARENCNCHVFHDPPCAACTIAAIAEAEAAARAEERDRCAKIAAAVATRAAMSLESCSEDQEEVHDAARCAALEIHDAIAAIREAPPA